MGIICKIFGHDPKSYAIGYDPPEQAWRCGICFKDDLDGQEYPYVARVRDFIWKLIYQYREWKNPDVINDEDLPF